MALNPLYSEIPEDPDLVLIAEKVLDRIHSKAVPRLQQELMRKNIVLTEKLLRGLSRQVNVKYQEKVVEFVIEMDLHGKFTDFRTMKYTGRPPIDDFEKGLLKAVDLGKVTLTKIPGYKFGTAPISKLAAVKRVAAAVVASIGKRATVTRPSSRSYWFKTYFEEFVTPMNKQLEELAVAVAATEAEHIIRKTLNDRTTNG